MPRGRPLAARAALRRTGKPGARTRETGNARASVTPKRTPPRETGFSRAVKLLIRARAGNGDPDQARCEACGIWLGRHGGQCQHIHARGTGGHSRASNGALLCGTPQSGCHGACESRGTGGDGSERMRAMGFWRLSTDPVQPVMLHGADGGVTVWLADDGGYSLENPLEGAA
jgi:hypothetical protein